MEDPIPLQKVVTFGHEHVRTTAFVVLVLGALAFFSFTAYSQHVRDDSERDAILKVLGTKNAELENQIKDVKKDVKDKVDGLEQQKTIVLRQPEQAVKIIHDTIPLPTPIQQLPDDPSKVKADKVELAQFGLSCKETEVKYVGCEKELGSQVEINKNLTTERDAAVKASKGGSVWRRTWRIIKVAAIAGGTGYVLGKVSSR